MGFLDILKQYATPGAQPSGDVFGDFDSVASQATPTQLGGASPQHCDPMPLRHPGKRSVTCSGSPILIKRPV